MRFIAVFLSIGIGLIFLSSSVSAEELVNIDIVIKNHQFTPSEIQVPADKPFFLTVHNQDNSAEELDMHQPKIEKLIPAQGEGKVKIPSLKAGRYRFVGEYHEETAKGVIVVGN